MQDDTFEFVDEQALRTVERIERALTKGDNAARGVYASLVNALEYQFEIPERDAETVRLLARALNAYAESRGVSLSSLRIAKAMQSLVDYKS